jgi:hypothetical protein
MQDAHSHLPGQGPLDWLFEFNRRCLLELTGPLQKNELCGEDGEGTPERKAEKREHVRLRCITVC